MQLHVTHLTLNSYTLECIQTPFNDGFANVIDQKGRMQILSDIYGDTADAYNYGKHLHGEIEEDSHSTYHTCPTANGHGRAGEMLSVCHF